MMVRLSLDQAQTKIIEEMRVRDFVDREIDAMVQIRIKGFEHRKVWQQKKKMFSAMVLKSLYFSEFYQTEIFLEFYRVDLDYSKYFW
jgi:predicted nucleic-acid-binding Zn-ribbon protein